MSLKRKILDGAATSEAMMEKQPNLDGGILIVDDHRPTVHLLLDLLDRAFPAQAMLTAFSAEDAMAMCQTAAPLVVVMDIGLPGINGIDAAREIKALSSAVDVVMHSSHDHAIYRERCIAAGADAFVSKAQTHGELIPAIALLLSSLGGGNGLRISVDEGSR